MPEQALKTRLRGCRAIAALLCCCSAYASAQVATSVEAHGVSDVIQRGASLTNGRPAIGLSASVDTPAGFFLGGGGYYADGMPSFDSLNRNLHAYVGWFAALGEQSAVEVSLFRSEFPSVDNWDYTELRADYHLSAETAVTLAYSPDYYSRDASHVLLSGAWQPSIGRHAYVALAAGAGYLSGPWDTATFFAEAGIGYRFGRFDTELSLNAVDEDSEFIFATDRTAIALRVSYRIW